MADTDNYLSTPSNYASPTQLADAREYAKYLMQGKAQFPVVQSWTQGASNVVAALMGGMELHKADVAERRKSQAAADILGGGNSEFGGNPQGAGIAPVAGMPASSDSSDPMAAYKKANDVVESGGNYGALGPVTKTGDRAYGRYQVMGNNVGPWTEKYLGKRMTPEEFTADKDAQDKVYQGEFGGYLKKYGNPQDAASMWFSGKPAAQSINLKDQLGTSGASYVDQYTKALGGAGGAPPSAQNPESQQVAQALQPPQQTAQAGPGGQPAAPLNFDPQAEVNRVTSGLVRLGVPINDAQKIATDRVEARSKWLPQSTFNEYGQIVTQRPGNVPTISGDTPTNHPGKITAIPDMPGAFMQQRIENGKLTTRMFGPDGKLLMGGGAGGAPPTVVPPQAAPQSAPAPVIAPQPAMRSATAPQAAPAPVVPPTAVAGGITPPAAPMQQTAGPDLTKEGAVPAPQFGAAPQVTPVSERGWDSASYTPPETKGYTPPWAADVKQAIDNPITPHWSGKSAPPMPQTFDEMRTYKRSNEIWEEQQKELAKKDADSYDKYESGMRDASKLANNLDPQLKLARKIVDDPKTIQGAGSHELNQLYKYGLQAQKLTGIDMGLDEKKPARAELLGKIMAGATLESLRSFLPAGSGQIRVSEINLVQKALGGGDLTPAGNRAVLDVVGRINNRTREMYDAATAYKAEKGHLDAGFDQAWSAYERKNPVFTDKEIEKYSGMFDEDRVPEKAESSAPADHSKMTDEELKQKLNLK